MSPVHPGGPDQTAVLVVRVWQENGEFRARVTTVNDVEHDAPQEEVTASRDELNRLVRAWMSELEDP